MAPSKLRKALGAVKDQTSIGLAKVGSGGSTASEMDVAVVKATRHGESFPADERRIREIISLSRCSLAHVGACVASLSRRLGRTRSWAVALKTLVLVHRLLVDGDPTFEREVFCATRRGTRMLNMSDFSDRSRTDAWDFSALVRTYAAYLDDRLQFRMQARLGGAGANGMSRQATPLRDELYHKSPGDRIGYGGGFNTGREGSPETEPDNASASALMSRDTPASEMTLEELFSKVHRLQNLLDRFVACRPVGAAKTNRVVAASLFTLVKESVQLYCELTEVMAALIERFPEMETDGCERVHAVFIGLAKQVDELEAFYSWCKEAYVCRASDVPEVEAITQKKLELMDEFIRDRRDTAAQAQHTIMLSPEPASPEEDPPEEYDMNTIRALPAPEEPPAAPQEEHTAGKTAHAEPPAPTPLIETDGEADLLNLKGDAMSGEEHGRQLALALFDGEQPERRDPFDHSSADWETALVQSASALASHRAELGGGLTTATLDGMYSHAAASSAAASSHTFPGSTSSVATRPPGAPTMMLALPVPPGTSASATDPFVASATVPPPAYVQMSDMKTKQLLLTEEQMVWREYGKNGMQGQGALATIEQRQQMMLPAGSYNYAGFHRNF